MTTLRSEAPKKSRRPLHATLCVTVALSCVLGLASAPSSVHATGQCEPEQPKEQYVHHPDFLPPFAAGRLGIVRREFSREFLVPAYLLLSGNTFDAATQKQLLGYWQEAHYVASTEPGLPSAESAWKEARKKVRGALVPDSYKDLYYGSWICADDAFRTAVKTLARLQHQPGVSSGDVAAWAQAQDQVFKHCLSSTKDPDLPTALPSSAPAALRAERDYQIAAARFYSGDHLGAAAAFGRIAQDPASPWAPWGTYLEARAHLRSSRRGARTRRPRCATSCSTGASSGRRTSTRRCATPSASSWATTAASSPALRPCRRRRCAR